MDEFDKENKFDLDVINKKIYDAQYIKPNELEYVDYIIKEYLTLFSMYNDNNHTNDSKQMAELSDRFMSMTTLIDNPNSKLILKQFLEDILSEQLNQTNYYLSLKKLS